MTTKSTDRRLAILTAAVQELAETFSDAWTARQVGQAMTCDEAETLRHVIAQVDPMAAGAFLRGHANGETQGDEPSDLHYHLRDDFIATEPHYYAGDDESGCLGCGQQDDAEIHLEP